MANIHRIALFLISAMLLFSCRKSTTTNWDVDLVIPVTTSQLNISNFLGDSLFKADNTGLFHLKLNRELAALKLDSLLKLPDTTIINSFTVQAIVDFSLKPGQSVISGQLSETEFDLPNGIELRKIDIRKSILSVKFSNTVNQPLDMIFKLPSATKNGQEFVISETIPTGTNSLVKKYDLSGYSLNMTGLNSKVFNTIVQSVSISVNPNVSSDAIVKWGQGLVMEIGYTDVIPEYIEGYFGQQNLELPSDTTKLNIYKNFSASNFMLSDANLNFSVINEIGADFSGSITKLNSFNSIEKKSVNMNNIQLNRMNINAAKYINSKIVSYPLAVNFNTVNSNITSFISNLPDKLSYSGSVTINPLGDLVKNHGQFAFYNTGIRILADIDIPVRFTANYFSLETESQVNFSGVSQLDDFNYGNFVITASNSFPFAAQLQAYLLNANKQIIDSLLIPGRNTINYGLVNSQNIVTSSVESKINVAFEKVKIGNFKIGEIH